MQIIISIMIIGLLWMIYDLINAPEVDQDENLLTPTNDSEEEEDTEAPSETKEDSELKDRDKIY
ncbi:MAG: hypothetical protein H7Y13_16025 [Sphingobacteriaceae bacterium]|nr:hypothetical protein [Sphingobacteriaceae bacterium]